MSEIDQQAADTKEDSATSQTEPVETEIAPENQESTESTEKEVQGEANDFIENPTEKVKARMDHLTAEKFAEKRRADDLQKKLDDIEREKNDAILSKPAPTEEQFDYDSERFHTALREDSEAKGRAKGRQDALVEVQQQQQQAEYIKDVNAYNARVAKFIEKAPDFVEATQALNGMNPEVQRELVKHEKGEEMTYWLSKNLEIANQLHVATPIEQGRILAQVELKIANGPKANQITQAGSTTQDAPVDGITPAPDEFMKKFPNAEII